MYNNIIERFKDKNIAILGFGKEGKSTYNFLRKHFSTQHLTILDGNEKLLENNDYLNDDKNITLILGKDYLNNLTEYDYIFKSPGVKIPDETFNIIKDNITSQIGIALELFRDNVIGVTGTKGKSTTSSLIYQVLKDQNIDCLLLGNVGNPIFDYIDDIKEDTKLVIEMSSYQLETAKHSPHISIILNLYEDHLNYHGTLEEYHYSKLNIYKYQKENDIALYTSSNDNINKYLSTNKYLSKIIDIDKEFEIKNDDIYYGNIKIYNKNEERYLVGDHNLTNILFVIKVALLLNLDMNQTIKTINAFKPLEHRMEYVGEFNGIKYYNDTIATIPEATISCLKALKVIDTIIFGGMDRGINYEPLISYFNESNIENFICMPETGYKLASSIKRGNIYKIETLDEAVDIAKKVTKTACLLSPAAPSYNAFKNFEEKGNYYKKLIKDEK